MTAAIRPFQPDDLEAIKAITIEGFTGVSVDHAIEKALGTVGDRDWQWRKARHVDEDVTADAAGIFVAEQDGEVVGYISTRVDTEAAKGRIPNLAVTANARGQGIGRALIEHALAHFRTKGMEIAVIETMESNPIGQTLYPSCGFQEIARQIHFAQRL